MKSRFTPSIFFNFFPSNCSSMVAVARRTWRREGIALTIFCILGRSRVSKSLSASSRTST